MMPVKNTPGATRPEARGVPGWLTVSVFVLPAMVTGPLKVVVAPNTPPIVALALRSVIALAKVPAAVPGDWVVADCTGGRADSIVPPVRLMAPVPNEPDTIVVPLSTVLLVPMT